MGDSERDALRVFFDTSVVMAGAFSEKGASRILIRLSGLTLLEGYVSADVRDEVMRNIPKKMPAALPVLRALLAEALHDSPPPSSATLKQVRDYADPKDVPILAAAIEQGCHYLVTLNERDFWPPSTLIAIRRPGDLLRAVRKQIGLLIP